MSALAAFARRRRTAAIAAIALGAVIFVAVNTAANVWFRSARADLTDNGLYTLSDGTRNILRNLNEPITLRFYFSSEVTANFPTVRAYAERIRDLLAEYKSLAGGNLIVEEIDPQPYTEAEDNAVSLGLQGAPTQGGETIYMGLSGTNMADGQETVPFFEMSREAYLEYDLTSMISRLAATRKPVLGVVTNLPLDTGPGGLLASMQGTSQPYVIYSQLLQIFQLQPLEQDFAVIPNDIDTLLIAHPKALSEQTLYAIDQFVMRGGRVIAFVDPLSEISQMTGGDSNQPVQGATFKSDLWLLKSWGVAYNADEVVLDRARAQKVQYGGNAARPVISYPVWLGLKGDADANVSDFDKNDLVTGSLSVLNLASAGHFTPIEGATTKFTPLIRSSDDSMLYSAEMLTIQSDPDELMRQFLPTGERYTIAARLSGPLKSAFTEAPKPVQKDGAPPVILPPHLTEAADANIIVVADSDLFDDRFWVQPQQQGDQTMAVPIADNLAFVAGAAENMLGSNDLISLRTRATGDRPFTLVEAMQQAADARFLKEEQDLNARIAETQEKLNALAKPAANGETTALTAEQQAEIDKFRSELTETRARLRDVQRELRSGIEQLGTRLALINIVAVPLLLIVVAIVIAVTRRNRMARAQSLPG
ncbi:MAG: Gldg family protein [Micropepsaceae bacterium]